MQVKSSYDTELACNVDDTATVSTPAIVRRKRLLLQHLLYLGTRAKPASLVVDLIDAVELFKARLMRSLYRLVNERLHRILIRHVGPDTEDSAIWSGFVYARGSLIQAIVIAVCNDDLRTALLCE
ncbi:hypothetical protein KC338_g107 [Hortaea werneckii]|nr:hypothetical protein KC338_g107 [Hortaea werneckii]